MLYMYKLNRIGTIYTLTYIIHVYEYGTDWYMEKRCTILSGKLFEEKRKRKSLFQEVLRHFSLCELKKGKYDLYMYMCIWIWTLMHIGIIHFCNIYIYI